MTGRRLLPSAGLLAFGLGVAVIGGEVVLRTYAAVSPRFAAEYRGWDPLAVLIEPHGQVGYRQKPEATFRYRNGTAAHANEAGFRGPEVATPKPDSVFRIVLVGGSTTHGWAVDDHQTIDVLLRQELHESLRGRSYEVVNLAFDAYDSWQVFERLRSDGMALEPDLVVVNTGVNDVRNSRYPELVDRDPRTLIWEGVLIRLREDQRRGGPTVAARLKHQSFMARLPGYVRQRLRRRQAIGYYHELAEPFPDAADYFERNLERIDSLLAAHSIPAVYSTPPSSLRSNFAPDATSTLSYWVINATVTQDYRDQLASRMAAFVARRAAAGRPVVYLRLSLPRESFLDDCHLTAQGNRALAQSLQKYVEEITGH